MSLGRLSSKKWTWIESDWDPEGSVCCWVIVHSSTCRQFLKDSRDKVSDGPGFGLVRTKMKRIHPQIKDVSLFKSALWKCEKTLIKLDTHFTSMNTIIILNNKPEDSCITTFMHVDYLSKLLKSVSLNKRMVDFLFLCTKLICRKLGLDVNAFWENTNPLKGWKYISLREMFSFPRYMAWTNCMVCSTVYSTESRYTVTPCIVFTAFPAFL